MAGRAAEPTTDSALNFAKAEVGKLPQGWTAAKTAEGDGSVWKIVADDSAPGGKALAQTSADGPDKFFNLCVAEGTSYVDVDLTISLKAIAGKLDQGGGPIWRCQDAGNYYLARVNPLENNFRAYKVVDGKAARKFAPRPTSMLRPAVGYTIRVHVVTSGRAHSVLSERQAVDRIRR